MKKIKLVTASVILGASILFLSGCDKNVVSKNDNQNKEESNISSTDNKTNSSIISSKVGNFVKYDNYIYFWKLNSNSRNNTELFGNWNTDIPVNNLENELVKMDINGNQEVVYKASGMGKIVVANNRIYTMSLKDNDCYIYSISLDGKDVKELGKGVINYFDNDMIVGTINSNKNIGIYIIDTKNGTYKIEKENAELLAEKSGVIYYGILKDNKINIGSIENGTDNGTIATLDSMIFKAIDKFILQVEVMNVSNNLEIYYGYRAGSSGMLQELAKATMNLDGSNFKTELLKEGNYEQIINNYLNESKVYILNDNIKYTLNGKETSIITIAQFAKENGLNISDESILVVNGSDVYNDVAYAIIDYGVHNPEEDIGWRYAYNRINTIVVKIDLQTNKITTIYKY